MCNHLWKVANDVRVCVRCGITISRFDGNIIFDRKLPDIVKRKGRKKNEK